MQATALVLLWLSLPYVVLLANGWATHKSDRFERWALVEGGFLYTSFGGFLLASLAGSVLFRVLRDTWNPDMLAPIGAWLLAVAWASAKFFGRKPRKSSLTKEEQAAVEFMNMGP